MINNMCDLFFEHVGFAARVHLNYKTTGYCLFRWTFLKFEQKVLFITGQSTAEQAASSVAMQQQCYLPYGSHKEYSSV
jgi:hypothetical protein